MTPLKKKLGRPRKAQPPTVTIAQPPVTNETLEIEIAKARERQYELEVLAEAFVMLLESKVPTASTDAAEAAYQDAARMARVFFRVK